MIFSLTSHGGRGEILPRLNFCRRKSLSGHRLPKFPAENFAPPFESYPFGAMMSRAEVVKTSLRFIAEGARLELASPCGRRFSRPVEYHYPTLPKFTYQLFEPLLLFPFHQNFSTSFFPEDVPRNGNLGRLIPSYRGRCYFCRGFCGVPAVSQIYYSRNVRNFYPVFLIIAI